MANTQDRSPILLSLYRKKATTEARYNAIRTSISESEVTWVRRVVEDVVADDITGYNRYSVATISRVDEKFIF